MDVRPTRTVHEHGLFGGEPIFAGTYTLDTDHDAHAHDFLEVAVVSGGTAHHVTATGEQPISAGDVLVLRPGAWHGFRACHNLKVANCCVSAVALRGELALIRDVPQLRRLLWSDPIAVGAYGIVSLRVSAGAARAATAEIARLAQDLQAPGGRRVQRFGRLVTVLGTLVDSCGAAFADMEVHPAVDAVVAQLEVAPDYAWTLTQLARKVSLDADYLGRLFRRYLGVPPMEFLARVRAERAAVLLAQTDLPISRVGAAVGWSDPTYFARRFRTVVGLTPTEYRHRSKPSPST